MEKTAFPNSLILWIEEQYEEYDPLLEDLKGLVGQEHVVVVRTGDEGRTQLRKHTFNLVLLDLMLPKNEDERKFDLIYLEAGGELLRELRQNDGWATAQDCSVIVLTARGNPDALSEVKNLLNSSSYLIEKPTPVEDIVRVVRNILAETLH